jgi:transcription antitermination factor NusG
MSRVDAVCTHRPIHPWYAIRTRAKAEAIAVNALKAKGYEHYCPSSRVLRKWADRTIEAYKPLFPGYIFCRFDANERLSILTTTGVLEILGIGSQLSPIPDEEIDAIRSAQTSGLRLESHPYLQEGEKVLIQSGALKGLEGILVRKKSNWKLIISVTILQRSVAVEVDQNCITNAYQACAS